MPTTAPANAVDVHVEALDTYGVATGDIAPHLAIEDLSVEIVRDQPPTVAIGVPAQDAPVTEGAFLLVQVNAVDDLGIDRVSIDVRGLRGGDRTFTDSSFPYEFLVEVPYGQAGTDLQLTATATERRLSGTPRTAVTPTPTLVHVTRDTVAPSIVVVRAAGSGLDRGRTARAAVLGRCHRQRAARHARRAPARRR